MLGNSASGSQLSAPERIPALHTLYMVMTISNTLFVGVDVDRDRGDYDPGSVFPIVNMLFAVYFTSEIFLRVYSYGGLRAYVKEGSWWNIFDLFFCVVVDLESFVLPYVISRTSDHFWRPFRLLRLLRIFRVYLDIPNLATIMRSIIAAVRVVVMLLAIQTGIIYISSLLLVNWTRSSESVLDVPETYESFGHVWRAALTFFQFFIADDVFDTVNVSEITWYIGVYLLVYTAVSTMLIYNILIGSVCRAVSVHMEEEREVAAVRSLEKHFHGDATSVSNMIDDNRLKVAVSLTPGDSTDIVSTYVKLCKPIQTQDLVKCLSELDQLYATIDYSILHE
jgi:hypothetical protein